jgi:molybdate transport system permease protein
MKELWEAFSLSLRIAVMATALTSVAAIPLAYMMARKNFAGKSIAEAIVTMPLVLPPTVVGYLIITTLGAQGWLGKWLNQAFGYSILFRLEGAMLAAAIVALPMLYLPAKAAFASVDRDLEEIALLMGANSFQVFWHVSLPLAKRGIGGGLILATARALGEFGATVMVFGFQPQKMTLSISIYADYEQGTLGHAAAAATALIGLSLGMMFVYNFYILKHQE